MIRVADDSPGRRLYVRDEHVVHARKSDRRHGRVYISLQARRGQSLDWSSFRWYLKRMRYPLLVLSAFTACASFAGDLCPTTSDNASFVPPAPYPKAGNVRGQAFYVGSPNLWVLVHPVPWHAGPLWPDGYQEKIVWYSQGYDAKADPRPAISISGRRLDGDAPPLVVTGANGTWQDVDFIMSGVNFPTKGCWEITGKFKGAEVKFVVPVE